MAWVSPGGLGIPRWLGYPSVFWEFPGVLCIPGGSDIGISEQSQSRCQFSLPNFESKNFLVFSGVLDIGIVLTVDSRGLLEALFFCPTSGEAMATIPAVIFLFLIVLVTSRSAGNEFLDVGGAFFRGKLASGFAASDYPDASPCQGASGRLRPPETSLRCGFLAAGFDRKGRLRPLAGFGRKGGFVRLKPAARSPGKTPAPTSVSRLPDRTRLRLDVPALYRDCR